MDGDPGLAPQPWVRLELSDGTALVDGVEVAGGATAEDRYLLAVQQIATEVATPLGRRVGVTVSDRNGPVRHLAIHPDGHAEDIDSMVREAAAAPTVPAPELPLRAPSSGPPADSGDRASLRRRLVWAVVAAAGVALLAGGVTAVAAAMTGQEPGSEPMALTTPTDPTTDAGRSAEPSAPPTRVVTRWRTARTAVVAEADAAGQHRVVFLVGADRRPLRVTLSVDSEGGAPVTRRLTLRGGIERVLLTGVPGGRATWSVTAPGAKPVTGRLWVPPGYVPPVSTPLPSSPPSTGGGSGSSHHSGGGHTPLPPEVTPVDPDDR